MMIRPSSFTVRRTSKIRRETLDHYGNVCACCGIDEFLEVDHIDGGGNKHRKSLGISGGDQFYRFLKKNGWPAGYRSMCSNCNRAVSNHRECPHNAHTPHMRAIPM